MIGKIKQRVHLPMKLCDQEGICLFEQVLKWKIVTSLKTQLH